MHPLMQPTHYPKVRHENHLLNITSEYCRLHGEWPVGRLCVLRRKEKSCLVFRRLKIFRAKARNLRDSTDTCKQADHNHVAAGPVWLLVGEVSQAQAASTSSENSKSLGARILSMIFISSFSIHRHQQAILHANDNKSLTAITSSGLTQDHGGKDAKIGVYLDTRAEKITRCYSRTPSTLLVRALPTYSVHPSLLCHRCIYVYIITSLNCHAITLLPMPTCCTRGNSRHRPRDCKELAETLDPSFFTLLFHISTIIIADMPRQRALHSPLLHCICNALNTTHLNCEPPPPRRGSAALGVQQPHPKKPWVTQTPVRLRIVQQNSTFLASFSVHDARLPLHPYNQRCKILWSTKLFR